ncbi:MULTISPECIES: diguanylate phosphodiesterase [Enterobacterales]|jgi:EAL domain-containing protein (putative c-di-GMP-specific phosphodiesterase class I)|uniref:EAL domain, c-di-GMP-specific phosphodiesterase class I (Or its enzymatically inactive variant) n=1 Tax=Candidatus Pantoea symbiotica TaxID=1884370 RepID=A0A1I3T099_9GAMM|nr:MULTISPECIES: diguanylate phosphodiesterase [Enterobacterales]MRS17579.1 EAL domain-containing protein [Enterobacteriaceae bacterium RIT692]MRT23484.1 EAL domain-containing protein [Enterobacteriaceae bacterium RIT697]MRT43799.1 EAL domain-containing protein [Enterobacteriaceae bacterium RIT702]KAJ9432694.1 diguanylate phosphodiesterase [Pantoea sp. YR343]MBB3303999.1 EAL domain-containing protein (putative c-di-GMP-specific phosphodiesterase class I) [Enterobacter sp. Sphag1F]
MLTTILYRSHLHDHVPIKTLEDMVAKANRKNKNSDVTGILLFDGLHFFQLLEGPRDAVQGIYQRICQDARHHNLVELMHDFAPERRFGKVGMELFDLREHDKDTVLQAVLDKGTSRYQLTYKDRALQFLRTFVVARDKENYFEIPPASTWEFIPDDEWLNELDDLDQSVQDCRFAFQPIIDPFARRVTSLEALIRTPNGGSPEEYFSAFGGEAIYHADIQSKRLAFNVASKLGIGEHRLSINLLPMSLVTVPNAVDFLLAEIKASGLVPQQVIVEVTENEIISRSDEFAAEVRKLKAAGISLALDDFGAGFAGLSLLSKFQPDKIKIDREIIRDVHKSGPKQAIMHAIIKCCASLEIAVIAEGVEQAEEWMWLEAAGISQFQGFLFAHPLLNGFPAVAWPEIK